MQISSFSNNGTRFLIAAVFFEGGKLSPQHILTLPPHQADNPGRRDGRSWTLAQPVFKAVTENGPKRDCIPAKQKVGRKFLVIFSQEFSLWQKNCGTEQDSAQLVDPCTELEECKRGDRLCLPEDELILQIHSSYYHHNRRCLHPPTPFFFF